MYSVKDMFQHIFTFPISLMFAINVSTLVGGGGMTLNNMRRMKRMLEAADIRIPRSVSISIFISYLFLGCGLLLFFGLLIGHFYVTGTLLDGGALLFVAISALITFSLIIFIVLLMNIYGKSLKARRRG